MKKKIIISICLVLVLVISLFAWFVVPKRLCNFDVSKVQKITIFSGHVGKEIEITDENEIKNLMNNFNSVKMKKSSIEAFAMGYMYRVTIETNFRKKEFIVDSKDHIRGSVFGYSVTEGDDGYDYIDNMFQKFYD